MTDDGREAYTDARRRMRGAQRAGIVFWIAAVAVALWLLRGRLLAGFVLLTGLLVLSIGAAGVAAPMLRSRRRGTSTRPGARWIAITVIGMALSVAGVVLLVAASVD